MTVHVDLQAEIARLKAENQALKDAKAKTGMKVSEKGALSVYGVGKFPVTLYKSQWLALLDRKQDILDFIEAHPNLKSKPVKDGE